MSVMAKGSSGGASTPIPVGDVELTYFKYLPKSSGVAFQWTDPEDRETGFVAAWKKTIIVRKQDSFPTDYKDGTIVLQETVRNTYSSNYFYDTDVVEGTTYYYGIFTQSDSNGYSNGVLREITPKGVQVMTVRIDTTNSNPETALTYMDDATSMAPRSDDWDEWFGCYPVILAQGGTEYKKLNPSDYTKFEDGTSANNYLANTGYDVMTAFPCMGVKIWTSGNYTYVSMTDNTDAESDGYTYYAHTKGTTKKDKFYLGAYDAYNNGSKLYSHSGKTPTVNITLTNARNYATARGTGYQLMAFYQWTFLQAMYILKYKNLNSQAALGRGWVDGSNSVQTGLTNAKGFNYGLTTSGTNTTNNRVKFLGIEDCWGNVCQWLDGCYSNSSRHLLTTKTNSNWSNTGSGYVDSGTMGSVSSYMSKALGTSDGGFTPVTASGSSSTYYADGCFVEAGYCVYVGGSWNNTDYAGVFYFFAYSAASYSVSALGCRICYL